jgi:hypothetical protein
MMACLETIFKPYNVVVTEVEPDAEPYHEVAITSSPSETLFSFSGAPSIGMLVCAPDETTSTVNFAFTNFSDDPLTVCQSAASVIGFTQGLTRVIENCQDAMTNTFGCNQQMSFLDATQNCGTSSGASNCSCTAQPTQNSYQHMLTNFGACPASAL